MLSQSGISTDSATGYRDIVKSLKIHLKTFVDELEETRVKVEGTAKTYHTLDKVSNVTPFFPSPYCFSLFKICLLFSGKVLKRKKLLSICSTLILILNTCKSPNEWLVI